MEKIIRVYTTDYARNKVMKLSARATQCFMWIQGTLEFNEDDHYFFDRALYMKEAKIKSANTVSSAIKELLLSGILTNTTKNSFYVVDKKVIDVGSEDDYEEDRIYKELVRLYRDLPDLETEYEACLSVGITTDEDEQNFKRVKQNYTEAINKIESLHREYDNL